MEEVRYVSHSELKLFRRCKRSWWLAYHRRLQLPRVGTGALSLGTLTHYGLEILYEGGSLDQAMEAIRDSARARLDAAEDPGAWLDQAQTAQTFVQGYAEWLEQSGADQKFEHVASEQELEMPLCKVGDVEYRLIGKLDRRVHDKQAGFDRFMDFKTCASFDQFIKDVPRNEQFPTYELLLRYNSDERTGGGIWRLIKKSKRARNGDGEYFMDYETSFNDKRLDTLKVRYEAICSEMQRTIDMLESGIDHHIAVYPTPSTSCSWDCDFVGICDMFDDGSRAESAILALYTTGDPYARYVDVGKETDEDG